MAGREAGKLGGWQGHCSERPRVDVPSSGICDPGTPYRVSVRQRVHAQPNGNKPTKYEHTHMTIPANPPQEHASVQARENSEYKYGCPETGRRRDGTYLNISNGRAKETMSIRCREEAGRGGRGEGRGDHEKEKVHVERAFVRVDVAWIDLVVPDDRRDRPQPCLPTCMHG